MDTLYRPDTYQMLVKIIDEVKRGVRPENNITELDNHVNKLLEEATSSDDQQNAYVLIFLLAIPVLIMTVAHYIQSGITFKLIPLVVMMVFILVMRNNLMRLSSVIFKPEYHKPVTMETILSKANYIKSGMELVESRNDFVMIFYILFFPCLVILTTDMLTGPYSMMEYLVGSLIFFALGGTFWYWFFKEENKEPGIIKNTVIRVIDKLS